MKHFNNKLFLAVGALFFVVNLYAVKAKTVAVKARTSPRKVAKVAENTVIDHEAEDKAIVALCMIKFDSKADVTLFKKMITKKAGISKLPKKVAFKE